MTESTIKDKTPRNRRYILDELKERKERENANKQKCITAEEVIEALSVLPELSTEMVLKNYYEAKYGVNKGEIKTMILKEVKGNLFTIKDCYYAHCISSDYALGAGIAVQFQSKFHLKNKLHELGSHTYPDCILVDNVFNLVTKKYYYNKPTYETLTASLELMKKIIIEQEITKLAMPKIGCGLDRLQWARVKEIVENIFKDIDIEIIVCHL